MVQAYAYAKYLGHLVLTFDEGGKLIYYDGNPILLKQDFPQGKLSSKNRTEVRFCSFLSGEFTTMAVINPPEKKLLKRTSLQLDM